MEGKISKYLLRSICLFVGVFIVSESLWACSYEEKEDRTNIKADTVLTYLDYPTGKLYIYNSVKNASLSASVPSSTNLPFLIKSVLVPSSATTVILPISSYGMVISV